MKQLTTGSCFDRLCVLLKDDYLGTLHGWKRIRHILSYYKFALLILCVILYIIGYAVYSRVTYKDVVLYTALVNVIAGEELTEQLSGNFMNYLNGDISDREFTLYTGLYLTDDELNAYHEYTYASRMKILAAIEGKQLDVVLMNREAFDAFSQSGYLCDPETLLRENDPALYEQVKDSIVNNIVILEDNSNDRVLDDSIPYSAVTKEYPMGLVVSDRGLIARAGFEDTVYLGIIANSEHKDTAVAYLRYLLTAETP